MAQMPAEMLEMFKRLTDQTAQSYCRESWVLDSSLVMAGTALKQSVSVVKGTTHDLVHYWELLCLPTLAVGSSLACQRR